MDFNKQINKVLIVQTASIGDVILSTPLIEKLHDAFEDVKIDFVLRKGSEDLFVSHPYVSKVYVWDKKNAKFSNFRKIIKQVRRERYDLLINLQRFATSGLLATFSKARVKIGFNKNPFSMFFTYSVKHKIGISWDVHEIHRNLALLEPLNISDKAPVKLYPSEDDFEKVKSYAVGKYITVSPVSLWATKQYPFELWRDFIKIASEKYIVYILGSKSDKVLIDKHFENNFKNNTINLSGELSLLETAALIKNSTMNYTNDSAPLHLASAMNAPVTAVFCSTVPEFGFYPLSDDSIVVQIDKKLSCRPCGLHGRKKCPENTMECGYAIPVEKLTERIGL